MVRLLTLLSLLAAGSCGRRYGLDKDGYHRDDVGSRRSLQTPSTPAPELESEYWSRDAQSELGERAWYDGSSGYARNVVMFLGDGMSVATLTAARTLLGQRRGQTGEESRLSFEHFPTVGLSKTYCLDAQVADSACSASAYLCGAKANLGTIGVSGHVARHHCTAATDAAYQLASIASWALDADRDAGIVTTTRVTHASPAGAYAHTADRNWESDGDVTAGCSGHAQLDIAQQLVHARPGKDFKVILGGGRREFLPNTMTDEEGSRGRRYDGRNLISEWLTEKDSRGVTHEYVWNRQQLMEVSEELPEYLLGLFEPSHLQYHMEANHTTEPTLAELTEVAIKSLSRNKEGFFLFVEGGRIDHAHHENLAHLALDETIELSAAVEKARELLSEQDSLIVVTADHAHVMSISGYTQRGGDILGPSDALGDDGIPYMTLSYGNGPGYREPRGGQRVDPTRQDYRGSEYVYPAAVPLDSETHGGDDVAVFAWGPHHALFSGLYEQSHIPHRMAYAACIGPGKHACQHSPHSTT